MHAASNCSQWPAAVAPVLMQSGVRAVLRVNGTRHWESPPIPSSLLQGVPSTSWKAESNLPMWGAARGYPFSEGGAVFCRTLPLSSVAALFIMPDTSVGKCLPLHYIQITEILGAHQESLEESKAMLFLPWAEICWREGSDLENKFILCCISLWSKWFALPEGKHFCYLLGNQSALLLWQCKFPVWVLFRGENYLFGFIWFEVFVCFGRRLLPYKGPQKFILHSCVKAKLCKENLFQALVDVHAGSTLCVWWDKHWPWQKAAMTTPCYQCDVVITLR